MDEDLQLLTAWRDGDEAAGTKLVGRHFDALYAFFAGKVPEAPDELLQRTLLACVEHRDRFEGRSSFRTYLFSIARNELFMYWRKRGSGPAFDPDAQSVADLGTSPSSVLARRQEQRLLLEGLRSLPLSRSRGFRPGPGSCARPWSSAEAERVTSRPTWADRPVDTIDRARAHAAVLAKLFTRAPPAVRIGRYLIEGRLGQGAMGVVYAARDPTLDRAVALKLVHPDRLDEPATARLREEAEALARLSHPNVVTVFELGEHDGHVFVVMERVDGVDLTRWLATRPRSPAQIVAVLVDAARGLAAAHAAGIVHRDFKPANVLVGDDGRARVCDFGLARAITTTPPGSGDAPPESSATDDVAGTLAFMAPETLTRGVASTEADQFALCVTAWSALAGRLPFLGGTPEARRAAIARGPVDGDRIDRRVRSILRRGLDPDPTRRWPDVTALVGALTRAARPARGGRRTLGGLVVVAVGLGWWARSDVVACGDGLDLRDAWTVETRAALVERLTRADATAADHVAARIDAYVDRFDGATAAACAGPHDAGFDGRMQCLQRERHALLGALDRGDSSRALVEGLLELTRGPDCDDADATDDDPVRTELRGRLRAARAIADASSIDAAQRVAKDARAIADSSLVVEADIAIGVLQRRAGDVTSARDTLADAYFAASAYGLHREAARAAIQLIGVTGEEGSDAAAAEQWRHHARASLDRIDAPDLEADLHIALGTNARRGRRVDEAREHLRAAAAAIEAHNGSNSVRLARVWVNLGNVDLVDDEPQRALDHFARADAILTAADPDDPAIATVQMQIGEAYAHLDQPDQARTHYERAQAILRASFGDTHPQLAVLHDAIGGLDFRADDLPAARGQFERGRQIREKVLGPEHDLVSHSLNNLGSVAGASGDHEEARRLFERALRIREAALGPDHPELASTLSNLAHEQQTLGDVDGARASLDRALRLRTAALGSEHPATQSLQRKRDALDQG